ncbi:hypothetical protein ACGFNV_44245, partial [Streptomyces sp. NPDC048751]
SATGVASACLRRIATDPSAPRRTAVATEARSSGVRSSRAIQRKCADEVAFRFLAADQAPDFRPGRAGSPT